jgi:hypothetical protein
MTRDYYHTENVVQMYVTAPEGYKTYVNKCTYAIMLSVAHAMSELCVTTAEY